MLSRAEWEELSGKLGEDFNIGSMPGMNKELMLSRAKKSYDGVFKVCSRYCTSCACAAFGALCAQASGPVGVPVPPQPAEVAGGKRGAKGRDKRKADADVPAAGSHVACWKCQGYGEFFFVVFKRWPLCVCVCVCVSVCACIRSACRALREHLYQASEEGQGRWKVALKRATADVASPVCLHRWAIGSVSFCLSLHNHVCMRRSNSSIEGQAEAIRTAI